MNLVARHDRLRGEIQQMKAQLKELQAANRKLHAEQQMMMRELGSLRFATALTVHHTTKEYQNAVRNAGHARGETGLTAAEQETREAIRRAKGDIRTAKYLATQWEAHSVMPGLLWQQTLLHAYWNGSLDRRLEEVSRQGSGDTMCRSPVFARPP